MALSRFLIRPSVRCGNLASKALGLCLRRPPHDFQRRYGYRPLLVETYFEQDRHEGASLAAPNWVRVGETAGRGRFAALLQICYLCQIESLSQPFRHGMIRSKIARF